ncbi:hypothetical protein [Neorhizobium sp. DT-125]|uniref:hypothetical protein n=1 Tax=Neorhizobium sp. DT-125 TaxID=3396163 RepID=UPI003F1B9E48
MIFFIGALHEFDRLDREPSVWPLAALSQGLPECSYALHVLSHQCGGHQEGHVRIGKRLVEHSPAETQQFYVVSVDQMQAHGFPQIFDAMGRRLRAGKLKRLRSLGFHLELHERRTQQSVMPRVFLNIQQFVQDGQDIVVLGFVEVLLGGYVLPFQLYAVHSSDSKIKLSRACAEAGLPAHRDKPSLHEADVGKVHVAVNR